MLCHTFAVDHLIPTKFLPILQMPRTWFLRRKVYVARKLVP
jgi:hypothetical protein